MSAHVMDHDHIDALLTFASSVPNDPVVYIVDRVGTEITEHKATEIGRLLLAENERSVRARYPSCPDSELPGKLFNADDDSPVLYQFERWTMALHPLWILKACDAFDYQACETDDYRESVACKIINAIRLRAIRQLPGYTDCPGWELTRDRAEQAGAANIIGRTPLDHGVARFAGEVRDLMGRK